MGIAISCALKQKSVFVDLEGSFNCICVLILPSYFVSAKPKLFNLSCSAVPHVERYISITYSLDIRVTQMLVWFSLGQCQLPFFFAVVIYYEWHIFNSISELFFAASFAYCVNSTDVLLSLV